MKLNANVFGLAAAVTVAVLWVICSLLVVLMPGMSMNLSGYMMHSDFSALQWDMHLTGFLGGLVVWMIFAYAFGWLMAMIYNRMA